MTGPGSLNLEYLFFLVYRVFTSEEAARFARLQAPPIANITPLVQHYVSNTLIPNSGLKLYDPSKISVNVQKLGEDTQPEGAVNSGDILQVSISLAANQAGGFYSYLIGSGTTAIVRSTAYTQVNRTDGGE